MTGRAWCNPRASLVALMIAAAAVIAAAQIPSASAPALKPAPLRRIQFSGFDWTVKSSARAVGPGPNFFSDSSEDVRVDDHGFLHLRISYRDGRWWSAEIICDCSPGFGTHSFRIPAGTIRDLDANAVLGLFNWSDEPAFAHREIDCELSTWGQKNNATGNTQFVVQPYDPPDRMSRFFVLPEDAPVQLSYKWLPDRVQFNARGASGRALHAFEHRGDIPPGGNPRINFWLLGGRAPGSGRDIEIVVEAFRFEKR
jgi:hypothetical protein